MQTLTPHVEQLRRCLLMVVLIVASASAAQRYFIDDLGTHAWTQPGNWQDDIEPGATDEAIVDVNAEATGGFALIEHGDQATCAYLRMSVSAAGQHTLVRMNGGTLQATQGIDLGYYHFYDDSFAAAVFEQNGGEVICADYWRVGYRTGKSVWLLKEGSVYCGRLMTHHAEPETYSRIEIGNGSFSVKYDRVSELQSLFGTVLFPYQGQGELIAEYDPDWTEYGRTIVYNSASLFRARLPQPADNAQDVPLAPTLSWQEEPAAQAYHVYLGTDFATVNTAADPGQTPGGGIVTTAEYVGAQLLYGRTYYWRVDTVTADDVVRGLVWRFSTPIDGTIDPAQLTATAMDYFNEDRRPEFVINGAGLTGEAHTNSVMQTMWLGRDDMEFPKWFRIDLGGLYDVDVLRVWNFNWSAYTGRGARQVDVYYSDYGGDPGNPHNNKENWTLFGAAGDWIIPEAPGTTAYDTPTELTLLGATARYLALQINDSWGLGYGGLSEVQVDAHPSYAADDPMPAESDDPIELPTALQWLPGWRADAHHVYLGTDYQTVAQATDPCFAPGLGVTALPRLSDLVLLPDTVYYWRVDEVSSAGIAPGRVWRFRTQPTPMPPSAVERFLPQDEPAVNVSTPLRWLAVDGAEAYDVYLGTDAGTVAAAADPNSGPGQGRMTTTRCEPASLLFDTDYYWRVDAVNDAGITPGPVWHFYTCAAPAAGPEFYVATNGNDANPGAFAQPFATLQRARDAVRYAKTLNADRDFSVWIRGGSYALTETLVLDERDSAEAGHTITYSAYPGETVTLCADAPLGPWSPLPVGQEPQWLPAQAVGQIWTAELPAGLDNVRVLYDSQGMLTRARTAGFMPRYTHNHPFASKNRIYYPDDAMRNWPNLDDAELFIRPDVVYSFAALPLASLDETMQMATTSVLSPEYLSRVRPGDEGQVSDSAWVENVAEGLSTPGRWMLNMQSRTVYLWPRDGGMPGGDVVAPATSCLIRIQGDEPGFNPVRNVVIRRLHFTRADRPVWTTEDTQGAIQHNWEFQDKDSALLRLRWAENCRIERCRFSDSGDAGVRLDQYCRTCTVRDSDFVELGGTGILLAGPESIARWNGANSIINNYIRACGKLIWARHGILLYQSNFNLIAHNLVHDMPYTGITLTGALDAGVNTTMENVVEYNEVHSTCQRLGDGNGIYLRYCGPGNTIQYNYVHDVLASGSHGAIRCDNHQADVTIRGNILYHCAYTGLIFKAYNVIENNLLVNMVHADEPGFDWGADLRGYVLLRPDVSCAGAILRRNVFYNAGPEVDFYEDEYNGDLPNCVVDYNLYYHEQNPAWASAYLTDLRALGVDRNSLVADPLIAEIAGKDINLLSNSPALTQLGFEPLAYDRMGLRGMADSNRDGVTDLADFETLSRHWLGDNSAADCAPDTRDGIVDALDLAAMMEQWLD